MTVAALSGFKAQRIQGAGTDLHVLTGGNGPPLVLLHGYPQSHVMWHKVAPVLAKRFRLVLPDLRGYGDSGKPEGASGKPEGGDHLDYAKRTMARDIVVVMKALGFERFNIAAHDRGARVSHRLAVDHPERVAKLMLLDIAPTLAMYEQTSMEFAKSYWWWFFLIQPAPFPETLINAQPETYLKKKIGYGKAGLTAFTGGAYEEYLRHVSNPATVHAMCEDYRAAASIDLEHDRDDRAAGRHIQCPLRVLWGEYGVVNRCFKPLEEWRKVTDARVEVTGQTLPCGHYIAEEVPDLLITEIDKFFAEAK
jgi:haloacetate dehalogenase